MAESSYDYGSNYSVRAAVIREVDYVLCNKLQLCHM